MVFATSLRSCFAVVFFSSTSRSKSSRTCVCVAMDVFQYRLHLSFCSRGKMCTFIASRGGWWTIARTRARGKWRPRSSVFSFPPRRAVQTLQAELRKFQLARAAAPGADDENVVRVDVPPGRLAFSADADARRAAGMPPPGLSPAGPLRSALARVLRRPPARRAPRPGRVLAGGGTASRKLAREARRRRRVVEADRDPREAARGFCRRCATTHRLQRTPAAEAEALALVARVRAEARLDFDAPVPDARFAVERMYEPGGGKMLGVLLATTPLSVAPKASSSSEESSEERGTVPKPADETLNPANVVVLKAFSGQLYGEWRVPGWAPPTCGLTHDSPRYVAAHAAIRDATAASAAKKTAADAIEEDIRAVSSRWDAEIERAAAKMRDARLAEESRAGKRALARLRDGKRAELAAPTEALRVTRAEFERLREVRRAASATLLGEIFDSYRLPNFRDAQKRFGGVGSGADETSSSATIDHDHGGGLTGATPREAFCAVTEEEGDLEDGRAAVSESSPPSSPPCGCGDCCAPKLLAECARRGLAPVAIAEVWMGAPTRKDGERREGGFYGACRGRCRPILGHMLCGAEELTRERGPIRLETGERASATNIHP